MEPTNQPLSLTCPASSRYDVYGENVGKFDPIVRAISLTGGYFLYPDIPVPDLATL